MDIVGRVPTIKNGYLNYHEDESKSPKSDYNGSNSKIYRIALSCFADEGCSSHFCASLLLFIVTHVIVTAI